MTETTIELERFHLRLAVSPTMWGWEALAHLEKVGRQRLEDERGAALSIIKIDRWFEDGAADERIAHVCFHIMPLPAEE